MLNGFIHQIVHHYIWSLEQSDVARDFKHGSIRCLLWREHEFLDALLNFPFWHFRSATNKLQKSLLSSRRNSRIWSSENVGKVEIGLAASRRSISARRASTTVSCDDRKEEIP